MSHVEDDDGEDSKTKAVDDVVSSAAARAAAKKARDARGGGSGSGSGSGSGAGAGAGAGAGTGPRYDDDDDDDDDDGGRTAAYSVAQSERTFRSAEWQRGTRSVGNRDAGSYLNLDHASLATRSIRTAGRGTHLAGAHNLPRYNIPGVANPFEVASKFQIRTAAPLGARPVLYGAKHTICAPAERRRENYYNRDALDEEGLPLVNQPCYFCHYQSRHGGGVEGASPDSAEFIMQAFMAEYHDKILSGMAIHQVATMLHSLYNSYMRKWIGNQPLMGFRFSAPWSVRRIIYHFYWEDTSLIAAVRKAYDMNQHILAIVSGSVVQTLPPPGEDDDSEDEDDDEEEGIDLGDHDTTDGEAEEEEEEDEDYMEELADNGMDDAMDGVETEEQRAAREKAAAASRKRRRDAARKKAKAAKEREKARRKAEREAEKRRLARERKAQKKQRKFMKDKSALVPSSGGAYVVNHKMLAQYISLESRGISLAKQMRDLREKVSIELKASDLWLEIMNNAPVGETDGPMASPPVGVRPVNRGRIAADTVSVSGSTRRRSTRDADGRSTGEGGRRRRSRRRRHRGRSSHQKRRRSASRSRPRGQSAMSYASRASSQRRGDRDGGGASGGKHAESNDRGDRGDREDRGDRGDRDDRDRRRRDATSKRRRVRASMATFGSYDKSKVRHAEDERGALHTIGARPHPPIMP